MTTARPRRLRKECSLGHGEDESVIEGEDDGRHWEGGWGQRWSYTSIGESAVHVCLHSLLNVTRVEIGACQASSNHVLVESV